MNFITNLEAEYTKSLENEEFRAYADIWMKDNASEYSGREEFIKEEKVLRISYMIRDLYVVFVRSDYLSKVAEYLIKDIDDDMKDLLSERFKFYIPHLQNAKYASVNEHEKSEYDYRYSGFYGQINCPDGYKIAIFQRIYNSNY